MPKIIVIHGGMAAGKSTITKELTTVLPEFAFVDRAYLKDTMLGNIKRKDPSLIKKISQDAMFFIAKELLEKGHDIILQEVRAKYVIEFLGDKYDIHSFYLHCSVEEAKKRDTTRQDKFVRPEVVEEKHKQNASADIGDITINTEENSIEETVKIILEAIK